MVKLPPNSSISYYEGEAIPLRPSNRLVRLSRGIKSLADNRFVGRLQGDTKGVEQQGEFLQ
jgi:hypothetical protein